MYSCRASSLQDMRPLQETKQDVEGLQDENLQGVRNPQETTKQSIRTLQEENNMHGVREAKQHSAGRGRGAR